MLEINDISVVYNNEVVAIHDASAQIPSGNLCCVIGPNGAGKSTLFKGIIGMVPATGNASFAGQPIAKIQKEIAYVEQKSAIDMDFPTTVLDMVLMGTYPAVGLMRWPGKKEKEKAMNALRKVKMEEFAHRQIGQLSGGQFQRVLIARCLAQEAKLIFLDEPFVGIDMKSERLIIDLLKEIRQDPEILVVVIHHDLATIRDYFDQAILVNHTIVDYGPVAETCTKENLEKTFGSEILELMGVG